MLTCVKKDTMVADKNSNLVTLVTKSSRKIAPSPNSNANPKPNPDPDRGAIFLGANFPDTLLHKCQDFHLFE